MPINKNLWELYKKDPKCCWCNELATREEGQVKSVIGEGGYVEHIHGKGKKAEIFFIFCSAEHAEIWDDWVNNVLDFHERDMYMVAYFRKFHES